MKRVLFAAMAAMALSGCASIMENGGTQDLKITSVPEGAAVSVFTKKGEVAHTGRTPVVFSMERSAGFFDPETYTILIRKRGYAPQEITLESIPSGWYAGNVVFGGLLGLLVVDPWTGGIYKLEPDEQSKALRNMKFDAPLGTQTQSTMVVILKEDLPISAQQQLKPLN
ncbi:MAG TPA: hypothetical protein VJU83_06420 [Burkholderiales bacterium]|nr:hypothetical protein [Burkholderiales bacterium]